ncbi:hypothetical protein D9M71_831730 [compost metagenome]
MLDRAMQQWRTQDAEQAVTFQRGHGPGAPIEVALRGEHRHQHQHEGQAQVERPHHTATVVAGRGRRLAGRQGQVGVHTQRDCVASA